LIGQDLVVLRIHIGYRIPQGCGALEQHQGLLDDRLPILSAFFQPLGRIGHDVCREIEEEVCTVPVRLPAGEQLFSVTDDPLIHGPLLPHGL
jgi:hypothetical protein